MSDEFQDLESVKDARVSTTLGIAAVALQMAIKYHNISVVKDGALYQQYKLEGRNMRDLDIDVVFETAIKIESHLLTREKAIARLISDALFNVGLAEDERTTEENRT